MSKLKDMHTPIFWAEGHPGPLLAEGWQVELGGLVEQPVTLTYEEILALPKSIADARLTSVSNWSVRGKWGGVRLSDLYPDDAQIKPGHVLDVNTHRWRHISSGEVIEFLD